MSLHSQNVLKRSNKICYGLGQISIKCFMWVWCGQKVRISLDAYKFVYIKLARNKIMFVLLFHKNVLHNCKYANIIFNEEINNLKFDRITPHIMVVLLNIIYIFFISIIVGVATNVSCQLFVASMSSINTDDMVSNLFFNLERIII